MYILVFSARSYMATLLRDGADLDSVDRSLLDCELNNERFFKIAHSGSRADIVSLDPTKLSLSCEGSLSKPRITSPTLPAPTSSSSKGFNTAYKLVRIVSPSTDLEDISCSDNKRKKETIVKFCTYSNTMVLASNNHSSEETNSATIEGEHSLYLVLFELCSVVGFNVKGRHCSTFPLLFSFRKSLICCLLIQIKTGSLEIAHETIFNISGTKHSHCIKENATQPVPTYFC